MPSHDDLSPTLSQLVDDAITLAIAAKEATDFRHPFLLVAGPSLREHRVLVDVDGDTSTEVERGRSDVTAESSRLDRYVLAYDGSLRSKSGGQLLAFILEAGEKGQAEAFVFFQRYDLRDGKLVLVFGDGGFLRRTDQLLR